MKLNITLEDKDTISFLVNSDQGLVEVTISIAEYSRGLEIVTKTRTGEFIDTVFVELSMIDVHTTTIEKHGTG